jgi:O-antigen/teichoic acid export membrane protein
VRPLLRLQQSQAALCRPGARKDFFELASTGQIQAWKAFVVPKVHRVAEFMVSQGITIAGNLLYGLLCIRLLPFDDYAKFVVVFAVQGMLVLLMDVGISGSLTPLVGARIDDLQLIADYVASLRQLAHWLFAIVAPGAAVLFPLLVRNRHWSGRVVAAMVAIVLVAAWFARVSASYGAVLIVRRDRRRWYQAQMIASLGTLALLGVFIALHRLNAFSAILINVSGVVALAVIYYFRARHLLGVRGVASKEKRTAIIQITMPAAPSVMFYAFQGQIAVFLITIFGRTAAVASVGALARLGQIFTIPSQMNGVLVEPYFARLPRSHLRKNYLIALSLAGAFGLGMVVLARFFPELFLWVLGPRYVGYRTEVVLVMISGAVAILTGLLSSMNGSRRFVFYSVNLSSDAVTILLQAFLVCKMDLSTVKSVLWFNIFSGVPALAAFSLSALVGFAWGGRRIAGVDYSLEQE